MKTLTCWVVMATFPLVGPALGQSFQNSTLVPVNGGFNGSSPSGVPLSTDLVLVNRLQPGNTYAAAGVALGSFASAYDLSNVAAYAQREFNRLQQSAALGAAMTILPPNSGDRFNFVLSGSGSDSAGAIAASVSYRLTNQTMIFAGYARSQSENLVKGGISLSIH